MVIVYRYVVLLFKVYVGYITVAFNLISAC